MKKQKKKKEEEKGEEEPRAKQCQTVTEGFSVRLRSPEKKSPHHTLQSQSPRCLQDHEGAAGVCELNTASQKA